MAVEIRDVLKASLVMVGVNLLNSQDEVQRFSESVGTEVSIGTNLLSSVPIPIPIPDVSVQETSLTLSRDRIVIYTSQNRTSIERDYPSFSDLGRLAEVAGHAIEHTCNLGYTLGAIGYNVELVYSQTSGKPAGTYLGELLFNPHIPMDYGWELISGNGRLTFSDGYGRLWNISLEPRFNDPTGSRVFMNLNAHEDNPEVPNKNSIMHYLQEAWEQSHDFVSRLDAS